MMEFIAKMAITMIIPGAGGGSVGSSGKRCCLLKKKKNILNRHDHDSVIVICIGFDE